MERLLSDLSTLLKTSSGSDMTLVCSDGKEVRVHSPIMTARSPVFSGMLESGMVEQSSRRVEIKDFGLSVVEAFVHYLYTAQIGEEFDIIVELMKIGNKYLVDALVDDCVKKLTRMLSKSNVLNLGAVAEVLSGEELLESCAKFVAKNLEVLVHGWDKDIKDSPMFMVKIINHMKSAALAKEAIVSRFQSSESRRWNCKGSRADAIIVHLDKMATLTSVGLYGTGTVGKEISVKIEICDDQLQNIFTKETVFTSTGSADPIHIPVDVQFLAGKDYTVSALINSDEEKTYFGDNGLRTVKVDDSLVVTIKDSNMSSNSTSSTQGQIPALGFVIL